MQDLLNMVERFQREVIGITIPETPTPLNKKRMAARHEHLYEELSELVLARTVEDQADALLDLIYLALGGLAEMGVVPGPNFEEVHRANMAKKRGSVASRPSSGGDDAAKPEGWLPPQFLDVRKSDLEVLSYLSPVLRRVTEMRVKKGQDYNSGVALSDYFPLGHASYFQMLHLKTLRIRSLLELTDKGGTPNFEGIEDTVLDLINYATFYGEWLMEQRLVKQGLAGDNA